MSNEDFESSRSGLFQDAATAGTNMSKNVVFKKICKDKSVSEEHHFLFISGIFMLFPSCRFPPQSLIITTFFMNYVTSFLVFAFMPSASLNSPTSTFITSSHGTEFKETFKKCSIILYFLFSSSNQSAWQRFFSQTVLVSLACASLLVLSA